MKAIVVRQPGDPHVLRLEEIQDPAPGPGEVIVALQAAALNRRDLLVRSRAEWATHMPLVPGSDGAGHVAAVGPGVSNVKEGTPVVICPALWWGPDESRPSSRFEILGGPTNGTYAQLVRVPAENVFPKPAHLSFEQAAAFPLAGLTAWRALFTRARLKPGERVLIPGVGSGVATFLVLLAKLAGARVYVTSGSPVKLERARQLGVDGAALYTDTDWAQQIARQCGGGVEVAVDSVGAASFDQALHLLEPGGRLVTFGTTSGAELPFNLRPVYHKQLSILGTTMGTLKEFAELLAAISTHRLQPIIDTLFPLSDAGQAHQRMQQREQFGKIVLKIE